MGTTIKGICAGVCGIGFLGFIVIWIGYFLLQGGGEELLSSIESRGASLIQK